MYYNIGTERGENDGDFADWCLGLLDDCASQQYSKKVLTTAFHFGIIEMKGDKKDESNLQTQPRFHRLGFECE